MILANRLNLPTVAYLLRGVTADIAKKVKTNAFVNATIYMKSKQRQKTSMSKLLLDVCPQDWRVSLSMITQCACVCDTYSLCNVKMQQIQKFKNEDMINDVCVFVSRLLVWLSHICLFCLTVCTYLHIFACDAQAELCSNVCNMCVPEIYIIHIAQCAKSF